MNTSLTRRGLFGLFARPFQRPKPPESGPSVAVIQGRHCLALTSFCAACVERCPVAGALRMSNGMPMVVVDVCTGCGSCHDVCPAPTNAVLLLPQRKTSARATVTPIA